MAISPFWRAVLFCKLLVASLLGEGVIVPPYEREIEGTQFLIPAPAGWLKVESGSDEFTAMEKSLNGGQLLGFWRNPADLRLVVILEHRTADNGEMRSKAELRAMQAEWQAGFGEGKWPQAAVLGRPVVSMQVVPSTAATSWQRHFLVQADLGPVDAQSPGVTGLLGPVLLKARVMRFVMLGVAGNAEQTQPLVRACDTWLDDLRQLNPGTVEAVVAENEAKDNDWWSYRWTFVGGLLMIAFAVVYARSQRAVLLEPTHPA